MREDFEGFPLSQLSDSSQASFGLIHLEQIHRELLQTAFTNISRLPTLLIGVGERERAKFPEIFYLQTNPKYDRLLGKIKGVKSKINYSL